MTHKHKEAGHTEKSVREAPKPPAGSKRPKLEIVLKSDSVGSMEALIKAISEITLPEADISIIHSSIGDINKSDLLLAETGSRLVLGFQVDLLPDLENALREHNIEVRLYTVIYDVTADIEAIAETIVPSASEEEIIGSAKVIALFKSTRKGIIIGCEVLRGHLAVGQHFRIITAMGPVYSGHIESIHIEDKAIQKAVPGQRVGIKIKDFNRAKTGDLVESFRPLRRPPVWEPSGRVIRK
jgi:translation initiation factor IF-2